MSEFRRRLMMAVTGGGAPVPPTPVIPTGYTQVEYLILNGAGSISFEVAGSEATDAYEVDLQLTTVTAQMRIAVYNATSSACQTYINGSLALGFQHNNSWKGISGFTFDTNRHIVGVDYVNKKAWYDDIEGTFTGNSTRTSAGYLLIGGAYTSNPRLKAYIYGARYWRSGELVRELIMCRDDNNNPYAYDRARGEFRAIAGTVTVGPDLII